MTSEEINQLPNPEELFFNAEPHLIEDYASNYKEGLEFAHSYPGDRPETSFLVDACGIMNDDADPTVYPMLARLDNDNNLKVEVKTKQGRLDLDELLDSLGQPGMHDRIPIVAYGANVAPAAAQKKYFVDDRPDIGVVPTLYAQLPGHEVVWFQNPGQKGNAIAALYEGPETADADVRVAVNFLTPAQLLALHRSEMNYDLGYLQETEIELEGGVNIPALIYAANEPVVLKDGKPVAVGGVKRSKEVFESMTSEVIVEEMLNTGSTRQDIANIDQRFADANSFDFASVMRELDVAKKIEVQSIIRSNNEVATASLTDSIQVASWSNPSTIPTLGMLMGGDKTYSDTVMLPTQEFEGATSDEKRALRNKVSEHFHKVVRPKL